MCNIQLENYKEFLYQKKLVVRQDSFTLDSELDSLVKNNFVWNFHFKHLPRKARVYYVISFESQKLYKCKQSVGKCRKQSSESQKALHFPTYPSNLASPFEWVFKELVAKTYYLAHGHFPFRSNSFYPGPLGFPQSQGHLNSQVQIMYLRLVAYPPPLPPPKGGGVEAEKDFLSLKSVWGPARTADYCGPSVSDLRHSYKQFKVGAWGMGGISSYYRQSAFWKRYPADNWIADIPWGTLLI